MVVLSPKGHFQNSCVLVPLQVCFPVRPNDVLPLILFSSFLSLLPSSSLSSFFTGALGR